MVELSMLLGHTLDVPVNNKFVQRQTAQLRPLAGTSMSSVCLTRRAWPSYVNDTSKNVKTCVRPRHIHMTLCAAAVYLFRARYLVLVRHAGLHEP